MIDIRNPLASLATRTRHSSWTGPAILLVPRHEDLLVVAPDGATHVVPLPGGGWVDGPAPESTTLLELLKQLRGGKRGRVRQAVLVLPRFQHLFRRFTLPPCDATHLASVIRYQIDLHTNLGADEACFDFYPLDPRGEQLLDPPRRRPRSVRFEPLKAGEDESAGLAFAAEVTSLAALEPYRTLLTQAGLALVAITTRSQVYLGQQVAEEVQNPSSGSRLLLVRDDSGIEVLLEQRGRLKATAYVEQPAGETLEAGELVAAIRHVCGACDERASIDRVRVWSAEAAEDSEVVRQILATEVPQATVECGLVSLESQLALVARDPARAGGLNLLRSTVETDPAAAPRRRRVQAVLAGVLALAGLGWCADSRLREMDDQIASLSADVQAAQQQIDRGDRTGKTHEAIATRWKNRQEWIPALDAVFRPMEDEDAVELAMLNADASRDAGQSEFVLSGTAPDSAVVPRLLARYAEDPTFVEVSPLGIRPQRNQDGEGVQFDLRVVRKAGRESRE